MRHGHGLRKLNRTSSHRLAMLQNMMNSLIEHEVIKTTVPKAKELRRVIEPMITLAKKPTLANKRLAFDRLRRPRQRRQALRRSGPAFRGTSGRLHAHPEDGFPRGRQRTDGSRRTGRPS
jgi:large subunit ribosomal protein L17